MDDDTTIPVTEAEVASVMMALDDAAGVLPKRDSLIDQQRDEHAIYDRAKRVLDIWGFARKVTFDREVGGLTEKCRRLIARRGGYVTLGTLKIICCVILVFQFIPVAISLYQGTVGWTDPQVYLSLIAAIASVITLGISIVSLNRVKQWWVDRRPKKLFRVRGIPRRLDLLDQHLFVNIMMKQPIMLDALQLGFRRLHEKDSESAEIMRLAPTWQLEQRKVESGESISIQVAVQAARNWDGWLAVVVREGSISHTQLRRVTVRQ